MKEFEVGDLVQPTNGGFIGVVIVKMTKPWRHLTDPWYKIYWDDGDRTEEDGRDIKPLTGGEI